MQIQAITVRRIPQGVELRAKKIITKLLVTADTRTQLLTTVHRMDTQHRSRARRAGGSPRSVGDTPITMATWGGKRVTPDTVASPDNLVTNALRGMIDRPRRQADSQAGNRASQHFKEILGRRVQREQAADPTLPRTIQGVLSLLLGCPLSRLQNTRRGETGC